MSIICAWVYEHEYLNKSSLSLPQPFVCICVCVTKRLQS